MYIKKNLFIYKMTGLSVMSSSKQKSELYLASSLCDGLEDNNLMQLTTLLKNNKADPNVLMPVHGITPFHLVIGNDLEEFAIEVTKLFLQYGGNPNVKSVDNMTPVHVAAAWGRTKILQLLLANGGDPLCLDCDNCSPFHYAFQGEHYEAVSLLNKYCTNDKKKDKEAKFKQKLDTLLFNNGTTLAECSVSESPSLDSLSKLSSILNNNYNENSQLNTNDYLFKSSSTNSVLNRKKVVTNSRKRRNKVDIDKDDYFYNSIVTNLNNSGESQSKEKQANSSVSNINLHNENIKKDVKEYKPNDKIILPKWKQITMTFNRPIKENEYNTIIKNKNVLKQKSTLQVIESEKRIPQSKNKISVMRHTNLSVIPNSQSTSKIFIKSIKNVVPCNSETNICNEENFLNHEWLDETIISKSPNLVINTIFHNEMKVQSSICEKRNYTLDDKKYNKLCYDPLTILTNKVNKYCAQVNHTPKNKRYFTTGNSRRKYILTPSKNLIFSKSNNFKTNDKVCNSQILFNHSLDESKTVLPNYSLNDRLLERKGKENLTNITINLDEYMSEDNKEVTFKKNVLNRSIINIPTPTKLITEQLSADLNEENVSTKEKNYSTESDVLDTCYKSAGISDSLLCEKGSILSDSTDNFLSTSNFDNIINNYKIEYIQPPLSDKLKCNTFLSIEEEYKYEDPEEGVNLVERRLCIPSCASSDMNSSFYSCISTNSELIPEELFLLDYVTLRERLKTFGENPGPITPTTYHLYLKRLYRLQIQGVNLHIPHCGTSNNPFQYSVDLNKEKEMLRKSLLSTDWIRNVDELEAKEQQMFLEFASPDPSRKWREGTSKNSFNYLLLDPRITKDLPRRTQNLTLSEKWETFLAGIFYVGKGKKSRPYAHLYDAFKIWVNKSQQIVRNRKIQRILNIWNEGKGVVVLHIFHNTIPVEAYTREALMIEVLGTQKLGNCKCGDYYGVVSMWPSKEKFKLGKYLLYKALQIMLLEGERQIFPDNL